MASNASLQTAPPATATTAWDLDPSHSSAEFSVRHLMISSTKGRFAIRSATVLHDPADPAATVVEAEVDVASVDTGARQRDDHLRSPDFFDAANHPTMRFRATGIEDLGEGRYRVAGDLTIRGATRPVALDVEKEGEARDPWGNTRAGLVATTSFDRRDFGLTWNQALETGGVLVGDKVKVTLHLEMIRRP